MTVNDFTVPGWELLRHGGLLLDPQRLSRFAEHVPGPLDSYTERDLRKRLTTLTESTAADVTDFVTFVLERVCGFVPESGSQWLRGTAISADWSRPAITGEVIKPRHLWLGSEGAVLPVFIDSESRLGVGRGRRAVSHAVQWLRAGSERLALLTNGGQWRLVFAGLDFDAWCEADADLFFEEGEPADTLAALRTLIQPVLWTPATKGEAAPLERAILDARKGQAELSAVLGERVREAVELLVLAHGEYLREQAGDLKPEDIYRAAVRVIMRMVVILFAESRELLPRDNTLYHTSYGLSGLIEQLGKVAHRTGSRLERSHSAWPRVLALFRLVHEGSSHPALPIPAYGGELFSPGDPESEDRLARAVSLFESGCFKHELLVSDNDVYGILERITRTRVKIRQGRASTWVPAPVDFSDLSSEYIGILYEGLLDFELRTAKSGDPVIFLSVGNTPALPLSSLEEMDDRAIANLLEKMKDTTGEEAGLAEAEVGGGESEEDAADATGDEPIEIDTASEDFEQEDDDDADAEVAEAADARHTTRTRAEAWARRAVIAAKLVRKPRGALTPEKSLAFEDTVSRKARQLVSRVVLPGEWYLVRWGGTRKGAGTFYTRPGLAVPTVQRTLKPLAYDPPTRADGSSKTDAPLAAWKPKRPEEILALKVCDPACGSGTFPVAALRFLTEALHESLIANNRISASTAGERALVRLFEPPQQAADTPEELLGQELIPCDPEAPEFEPRLKAVLRRHVVERCIHGVDIDPLAVELCRLSLWIETMDRTLPFSFLDHKIKCGNSLVGAWFDTYRHYPAMAFKNREGGDKSHGNGDHFEKDARGKAIKKFVKEELTPDLKDFITGQLRTHEDGKALAQAAAVHDGALVTLKRLHDLPVHDADERARIYNEELIDSPAYLYIRGAMDLWCACWFWPADQLDNAPLPTTFSKPDEKTCEIALRLSARLRFFHWELEFPDVFRESSTGFDAVLGNPPWETLQPNSKEYFSNVDPLFRSYGKQEALRKQTEYFANEAIEKDWLDYNADFACYSNWMKHAASPFGDPAENEASTDRFAVSRGRENEHLHQRWRDARAKLRGYANPEHPFRHRGEGKAYTYKLFLEAAHALLRPSGRMGFIVPSGLYSDHGTGSLRELFIDHCRWEWLFGFENRESIFDIHRSFKFNPVIIEKGGSTDAIQTAFMRRSLEDWERAEELVVPYSREQVERFSPRSRAILEIQSVRDLEILEKIYANSVLLGDDGPDGWGVKYAQGDFNMTSDSKLFPPRPWWEERGYRPDEYSRWLLGNWRPIEELWAELGIDPARVKPVEIELEDWLFDTTAGPERREAEARFIHDHLLKPGDVARTNWRRRCAQPPYDALPIPRTDIPAGIILSREADTWIREEEIEDTALPLYEGRMIGQFDFSQKGWVSGKGRSAVWRDIPWERKQIEPQYLMKVEDFLAGVGEDSEETNASLERLPSRLSLIDVTSSTNTRTTFTAVVPNMPHGHSAPVLRCQSALSLTGVMNSIQFDWIVRLKMSGVHLVWAVLAELPLPSRGASFMQLMSPHCASLDLSTPALAIEDVRWHVGSEHNLTSTAILHAERLRLTILTDVLTAYGLGLDINDVGWMTRDCDFPTRHIHDGSRLVDSKGFWRIDKDKDPELRHTALTLIAFQDLEEKIRENGGDRDAGIAAFLNQNHGEGWMLPETLCLAYHSLGHDERAKQPQPVASRLGPRFYDWQLTQTAEESWRECHLHARNLLGEDGYRGLLAESDVAENRDDPPTAEDPRTSLFDERNQERLW